MANGGSIPMRRFGKSDVQVSALAWADTTSAPPRTKKPPSRSFTAPSTAASPSSTNCWEYNRGKSEDWLGKGLKGRRDKVFLMTKVCTHGRDAKLAMQMLEQSLRRLQTDHLDLWQIHGVSFQNDA